MTVSNLIETRQLGKRFGELVAVEDLSLQVREGEILALLGPNGAGKTTTIRMLASILKPTSGRATVAGYDVVTQPAEVRRSIGLLTEHHGLYTRMNARSYLQFFGKLYGMPADLVARRSTELLATYDLEAAGEQRLGEYSRGMRQKLALIRALLHDPPVLLLDEPTSALDPESARTVRKNIASLRRLQRTIIVCTHNLAEAEGLADRIAIIRRGRIISQGYVSELRKRLLGAPLMEVTFAGAVDGAAALLPPGVQEVETGEGHLRYRTPTPELDNPRVLAAFSRAGFLVVTLSEVRRSLEEIYLQVVSGGSDER